MQQCVDYCPFCRLHCAFNYIIHTPDRVWLYETAVIKNSRIPEQYVCQIFRRISKQSIYTMHYITATTLLSLGLASAYDIPDNLKQIYNSHKVSALNIPTTHSSN